ncbi:RNI-like protein [Gigaspora margarita]|uniref:RNI-like protein n=1 Tax=Gigaspora margarita TaxID=4874 RepID=A0A8H3X455_GIGMA|nr:RNI-like protein [Gigaspora margarita]
MKTLPNECLLGIFNNLQTCNGNLFYRSLFSCLLVNRKWCRIIIPILWSKPTLRNKMFIRTCLLLLNVEEQALLIPFNITLPNNSTPLFKYTSYISHLNCRSNDLGLGIKYWLENEFHFNFEAFPLISIIKYSLIKMFLRTNIGYNQLGSECGKIIAETLCINTTLTSLNIERNQLGSESGKVIAEALCKNNTLTSLNIGFNKLGSECGKTFAEALCINTTLTHLNIEFNLLGSESGKAITEALYVNTTLTSLSIKCNQLGFKCELAIAEAIRRTFN